MGSRIDEAPAYSDHHRRAKARGVNTLGLLEAAETVLSWDWPAHPASVAFSLPRIYFGGTVVSALFYCSFQVRWIGQPVCTANFVVAGKNGGATAPLKNRWSNLKSSA